jgi:lipoprotein-anchoring transpeptidase ErfK/SrfK
MKKRAIYIIIPVIAMFISCTKKLEIGKCKSSTALLASRGAIKALKENKKDIALKLLLKSLDKCTLPKSHHLIGKIYLSEGEIVKSHKHLIKALYLYNKMCSVKTQSFVKDEMLEIYFDLACLSVAENNVLEALAYLKFLKENKYKHFSRAETSPYMAILYGSKYKNIFKAAKPLRKAESIKYFSYYEGYNPFKMKVEININDYKAITSKKTNKDSRNKLFLKYQIDKNNPIIYKVIYDKKDTPVKMDILIGESRKPNYFIPSESFYFDETGRLYFIKSYQPHLNGLAYLTYYYYSGDSTKIIKLVRFKMRLPFYVKKIFIQQFK